MTTLVFWTHATSSPQNLPSDWNSTTNTVDAIGEGGNGAKNATTLRGGAGGGGGAWQQISNYGGAAGASTTFTIGGGGSSTKTQFNSSSTLVADFGTNASNVTHGAGGLVANCFPTTGGNAGGSGVDGSTSNFISGGGGGGAAGPTGAGKNGAAGAG